MSFNILTPKDKEVINSTIGFASEAVAALVADTQEIASIAGETISDAYNAVVGNDVANKADAEENLVEEKWETFKKTADEKREIATGIIEELREKQGEQMDDSEAEHLKEEAQNIATQDETANKVVLDGIAVQGLEIQVPAIADVVSN
ncbi:unnamed protein product [Caenorhabditis auriculariae]|uniref:Uncharacterized protein n=1 Tax=Caenorhabditis auriculariae TaxID=2777116 RepID=A0A8S1HW54_9PELO|nr:unnamed protein product [Caenorhabditis auriculariae]